MNLLTNRGKEFELRTESCRDEVFFATRAAVRKSVETGFIQVRQHRRKPLNGWVLSIRLSAELTRGQLRLGCHTFDRKSTKQIFRWAGVKA